MRTKIKFIARIVIALFLIGAPGRAVFPAEMPRARLDESERQFTRAYMYFLDRDYWSALDYLDRALKANTYMVDYYLLRGLIMDRIGDLETGRESLSYYLEVRPRDAAMPRVLSYVIGLQRDMRAHVGASALSARWRVAPVDLQTEFGLGYFKPFSIVGLGKADAFNPVLCLADTLGHCVYFSRKSEGRVRRVPVESPAAVLPLGDGSFRVLSTSGDVRSFLSPEGASGPISLDIAGSIDCTVTDAVSISSGAFAVSDPIRREVLFYSPTLEPVGSWAPPDQSLLFEPVGLSAYGSWIAVADRGNERIFFVDVTDGKNFFSVDVSRPRDVAWSPLGELLIISEDGGLYRVTVDFRDRRAGEAELLEGGLEGGWTLFTAPTGDIYCLDIAASKLWKAVMMPDVDVSPGYLSLFRPVVSQEENRESFLLDATLISPFVTTSETATPVVHAVWNNRLISSFADWKRDPGAKAEMFVFHRPAPVGAVSPALKNMVVENGTDIQIALPSIWSAQKETLTNVVIDSSINFSQEELDTMTFFCLNNGLELDVWARSVPAVEMVRAAALSGGKVVFSVSGVPDLSPPRSKMQIRIPLPQELASSGYPGRSMLTVYLDLGMMSTRDWIPLWPDLLGQ
ncbi:MAG: hypothetical protein LBT65_06820 [Synergistaceae bacterium]|jgi:hypothetical protein|nr:hypothetical protein [Synergistaceae bacterium]